MALARERGARVPDEVLPGMRAGARMRDELKAQLERGAHMAEEKRDRGAYCNNDYFRMGAAVAVGGLYDMAALGRFLTDDDGVKSYLGSFGIEGMEDVGEVGIKGSYRRDFEKLHLGRSVME